jgi:tRNA U34 5-methylaminomethyl-2-thiouridine-forming methyltransferase MnmC
LLKIITTSDGSHSLLNEELNETYHSVHGAIRESLYVFIQNGLEYWLKKNDVPLSVFEVGFGTGLNALLTLQFAKEFKKKIHYTTIEPFPLPEQIWSGLNYPTSLHGEKEYDALHIARWDSEQSIDVNFTIRKLNTTLEKVEIPEATLDVVYFDAFAPSKQPELWNIALLEKVCRGLKPGGVLVTYCAKGQLKRDLKSLGLMVETLPGPPGKKEMVRGAKGYV